MTKIVDNRPKPEVKIQLCDLKSGEWAIEESGRLLLCIDGEKIVMFYKEEYTPHSAPLDDIITGERKRVNVELHILPWED